MTNRIGIDIGGTFTDLVIEEKDNLKNIGKVLSTPDNLVEGAVSYTHLTLPTNREV